MEKIIHLVEEYLGKVFTVHAYGITDLDATASELKKDSDELSRKILQILIEKMNESFREDKSTRKEMGLVIKEKGKMNKAVPLVTVTEGTVTIGKGRNATLNPMHFVDEKMNSKDLWASVEGYIGKVYDLDACRALNSIFSIRKEICTKIS